MNNNHELTQANNTAAVLFSDDQAKKAFTLANLIFNPPAMEALNKTAVSISNSGLVPDHLRGKPDDVMAVIMQAGRWGMDPIAVAQASFVLNGKLGYEAKLQQAVARANGGIEFEDSFYGDWDKIQGNFSQKTSQKGSKYNSPNWTPTDEQGVGIRLKGIFPDGRERTIDVPLKTCYPRNSTNWANDPQQQIYYTAVKRWVRRYAPHLGLGIQDYDDLSAQSQQAAEREINPLPKQEAQKKSDKVEDISDILNSSTVIRNNEQEHQAQEEKTTPVVSSVDDILNQADEKPANVDDDGVYTPSVYEQMIDLLHSVKTIEDYKEAKAACLEAFNSGLVVGEDAENLGKSLRTMAQALNIKA